MQRRRWAVTATVLLLSVSLLAACGAPGSGGPGHGPVEPVVFDTTRVADADTRAALLAYDHVGGELRFARTDGLLGELAPGDVIVSEPSAAAPDGYLRLIHAVRTEGDELVLETTQARLIDAIQQGDLDEEFELRLEDVETAIAHVAGVRTAGLGAAAGVERRAGVGKEFSFELGFDEVVLDFGEGASAQVRVEGQVSFSAGAGVHVRIRPCLRVPPACVRSFEAKVGVEQEVALSLSGEANATVGKEILVKTYLFKPFTFFIGPVPVVVRPQIDVYVGASGEINLRFAYALSQSAIAQAGARWTPGDGWQNITGFGFDLDTHSEFVLEASMQAEAYVKPGASLLLYGIAGPFIAVSLAAEIDAVFPRDPVWILRGAIVGSFGFVVDVPVIGRLADYEAEVFRFSKELARSQNAPPEVVITAPPHGSSFPLGVDILFEATAVGFVGNPLPLLWFIGDEIIETQPNIIGGHALFYGALPPGGHVVVAKATDTASGLEGQAQVTVEVTYDPPEVFIVHPNAGDQTWANQPLLLVGQGLVGPIALAAEQHSWRVAQGATTVYEAVGTTVTVPEGMLPVGTYQVTLEVDDGVTVVEEGITVTTIEKPAYYPTATILSPESDDVFADGDDISFHGEGSDPEDGPLPGTSLRWTAFAPGVAPVVLCEGSDFLEPGAPTKACDRFTAPLTGYALPPGTEYTIQLEVRDGDANVDKDSVRVRVVVPPAG